MSYKCDQCGMTLRKPPAGDISTVPREESGLGHTIVRCLQWQVGRLRLDNERLMLTRLIVRMPDEDVAGERALGWYFHERGDGLVSCTPLPWSDEFGDSMDELRTAAKEAEETE